MKNFKISFLTVSVSIAFVAYNPFFAMGQESGSSESNPQPIQDVKKIEWNEAARQSAVLVDSNAEHAGLDAKTSCTVALWVRMDGSTQTYPALASSKTWEGGDVVDMISEHNMGITLDIKGKRGWTIAVQPNGSWLWNLSNGKSRLDYMPTTQRQPINDDKWHLLAFTVDRKSNTARLFYDGKNVAIYAINGFGNLTATQDIFVGGDRADQPQSSQGVSGKIENAGYYATALSDEDIFKLYQARFPDSVNAPLPERVDDLKVLSWNIWHGGRHPGTEKGVQQVVNFIKSTQADVITMQETYGSGPIIADRLGYYFYLRSTNLSVMSRYPIEETHDLYQPFRLGGVTLRLSPSQQINVFSLWIHYLPAWRRDTRAEGATAETLIAGEWKTRATEMKDILAELKPFIDSSADVPLIIGGDFNSPSTLDWTDATSEAHNGLTVDWPVSRQMLDAGFSDSYRMIHADPNQHEPHPQWKADANRLTYRIDYIYSHGQGIAATKATMMNTHNQTWPSDHPAMLASLRLQKPRFGIISYNILEGFTNKSNNRFPSGNDRKQAVSDWLTEQSPAIVGLQELNGYSENRLKKEALGWGHNHAATVKNSGYIVGLTSRNPIKVISRHLEGMHHGLLHCRTGGIDCFVVHLSPFSFRHRQKEADIILNRVKAAMSEGKPVLVLGDFNALSPLDREAYEKDDQLLDRMRANDDRHDHVNNLNEGEIDYSVMQAFLDAGLIDPYAQRQDYKPEQGKRRIDFILTSPDLAKLSKKANWHTSKKFKRMSDHSPVSAELDFDHAKK